MKKFLLLLTLLVSFGGMVHAESLVIEFNNTELGSSNTSYTDSEWTFTKDGFTFGINHCNPSTGQIRANKNMSSGKTDTAQKAFYLYNTTAIANVSKVTITFTNNQTETNANLYYIHTATAAIDGAAKTSDDKGSLNSSNDAEVILTPTTKTNSFFRIDMGKPGGTVKISKVTIEYATGPQTYNPPFKYTEVELGQTRQFNLGESHPEITYTYNPEGIVSIDETGKISTIAEGETDVTASYGDGTTWSEGSVSFTIIVTKPLQDAGLAYSAAEAAAVLGEAFEAPVLSNPNSLTVTYTSSDEKVATVDADGIVTIGGAGTTTIKASFAGDDDFRAGEASYTLTVTKPRPAGAIDEILTATDDFKVNGATSTTYHEFTYTSSDTEIEYNAFLSGGLNQTNFQMRTEKGESGIVINANKSGYIAHSIQIEWASSSSDTRSLALYGKHKAYTAPSELHSNNTQGTLLNTFAKSDTEFEFKGEYNFIGLRSTDGAIYVSKITITWVPAVTPDAPVVEGFTEGTAMSAGDKITIKGKPGQHLHYIIEKNAQFAMKRAAATEGWTPADSHEYTYTLASEELPVKIRAKAVNGAGTHESEEVVFGIDSTNTPTGVEAIEAEGNAAEVEWFNLQGVRVENPAQGLYIRRQGNKVEKVVVK